MIRKTIYVVLKYICKKCVPRKGVAEPVNEKEQQGFCIAAKEHFV